MAIREYAFNVGVETSDLPTAGTPSGDNDLVTKGYADKHYMEGRLSVADITALKAVGSSDRTEGMVCLVESTKQLYVFDSDASDAGDDDLIVQPSAGTGRWFKISSAGTGSGSGELNYIENPSAASSITGWSNVGDLDVARTTTAAQLPRENIVGTGILITANANTQSTADYVYYDFILDDVDLSRVLKIQWDQKITGSYVAGNLAVVITTQAYRTTALFTPSVTAIPASDGTFGATFVTSSATATLSLVIRATTDMATNAGIVISNVVVGPGTLVQGPAVGDWSAPTTEVILKYGTTTATNISSYSTKVKRCTDSIDFAAKIVFNGAANANGNILLTIPNGLTINTSKIPSATVSKGFMAWIYTSSKLYGGFATVASSTELQFFGLDNSGAAANQWAGNTVAGSNIPSGAALANNDYIAVEVIGLPVNEYSGGVFLGSGADATSVLDWTSFTPTITASGGGTVTIGTGGASPEASGLYRRVGDSAHCRIYWRWGATGTFGSSGTYRFGLPTGLTITSSKLTTTSNVAIGSGFFYDNSATDIFGLTVRASNSGYVIATIEESLSGSDLGTTAPVTVAQDDIVSIEFTVPIEGWTSADYLGKMLTGFSSAIVGRSGLVNNDSSNTAGTPIKGRTDGVAPSAGYVGERKSASQTVLTAFTVPATYQDLATVTLTAGIWLVSGNAYFSKGTSNATAYNYAAMWGSASGSSTTGYVRGTTAVEFDGATAGDNINISLNLPTLVVYSDGTNITYGGNSPAATQVLRLKGYAGAYSSGDMKFQCSMEAVRIA